MGLDPRIREDDNSSAYPRGYNGEGLIRDGIITEHSFEKHKNGK